MNSSSKAHVKNIYQLFLIALIFTFSIFSLWIKESSLAIGFGCYGIILYQSRLEFRNYIKGFLAAPYITRGMRLLFFFIPTIFLGWPQTNAQAWGTLAGMAVGIILIIVQFNDIRFVLSQEYLTMFPPISQTNKIRDTIFPIAAAAAQEYFYRGMVLKSLVPYFGLWAVMISALLFTAEHFFNSRSAAYYDWKDYFLQFVLGIGLGSIFYLSGSLMGAFLGHAIYNIPGVIQTIKRKTTNTDQVTRGEHGRCQDEATSRIKD